MNQEELKQRLLELIADGILKSYNGVYSLTEIADHLIANGVTIRERGEWIKTGLGISERVVCSQCGSERGSFMRPPFCNQCGADMRGVPTPNDGSK